MENSLELRMKNDELKIINENILNSSLFILNY